MYFPGKFTRAVSGNAFWPQDVLPTGALPANTDIALSIRPRDLVGFPVHRLAVGYSGPAGASYLPADLYAWEGNSQQWLKTHDGTKVLRPGRVNYFDLAGIAEPPVKISNLDQGMAGGTDYVLIVTTPPNTITPANGTYTFAMAADLTTLGTEEPNPDDEANDLRVITPNDGVDNLSLPYGPCRWIWCTTATGNIAFQCVDGQAGSSANTVTIPSVVGKLPFRARNVKATGTTVAAGTLFAAY